jgi:hypothetical protein
MAIELNNRIKALIGVVVLAAAGAGAWFFYFDEPPPPPKTAAVAPAKPAAEAPKAGEAPKAADAPKAGDAPKPAAASAKPIPTNPDQLVAEVIEISGLKTRFATLGGEFANFAAAGANGSMLGPDGVRAVQDAVRVNFDSDAMTKELAVGMKANLDQERMSRFLEILRQPLALKIAAEEAKPVSPQEMQDFVEATSKSPLPAARVKLIQALDDTTRSSAFGGDLLSVMAQDMVDTMLSEMQKAGKKVNPDARRQVSAQLNQMRSQIRNQILATMQFVYRNVSDEDLAAYVKLYDTDTGRWGTDQVNEALRPVMTSRFSALGRDVGRIALANRTTSMAKAPAEPPAEPLAKAQPAAPAESPGAAPAPPPPGYQRASNVRDLYTRYNDLVSATVMRDKAGVKELLDDGKFPDARQKDGLTPLMIAASNGDDEIVAMLLAKGADPNLRASGGASALSLAKARRDAGAATVKLLQGGGAKD